MSDEIVKFSVNLDGYNFASVKYHRNIVCAVHHDKVGSLVLYSRSGKVIFKELCDEHQFNHIINSHACAICVLSEDLPIYINYNMIYKNSKKEFVIYLWRHF